MAIIYAIEEIKEDVEELALHRLLLYYVQR
jgi:hypothetical protein